DSVPPTARQAAATKHASPWRTASLSVSWTGPPPVTFTGSAGTRGGDRPAARRAGRPGGGRRGTPAPPPTGPAAPSTSARQPAPRARRAAPRAGRRPLAPRPAGARAWLAG